MNITLDVHTHLIPIDESGLTSLDGVEWNGSTLCVDDHTIAIKTIYQPQALLDWMEQYGVVRALVSSPPPLYRQQLDIEEARTWWCYVNEALHAIVQAHDERLGFLPHLPLEHPELACEIAAQYTRQGFSGFSVPAGGVERLLFSSADLEPLWQQLDEVKAFVFLHPASCCDGRLKSFYLENLTGNPHETGVATAHLVFAAVPARYSRIKFCLAHAGGSAPMLAGRWQHGFDMARPGVDTDAEAPRDVLRRLYADCIAHDEHALALAASVFGQKHILFGSDWPFPMGLKEPTVQLESLDKDLQEAVLRNNARAIPAP